MPLVVVSELDVVASVSRLVLYYHAQVTVIEQVFINDSALHIIFVSDVNYFSRSGILIVADHSCRNTSKSDIVHGAKGEHL